MVLVEYQKFIISSLAVVATVGQFLSGVLVCKQYVVNQTTAEASSLPFVSSLICCCMWFFYGLFKQDNVIVLVNTIGAILMITYTIVFYMYSFKKSAVLKQVLGAVLFVLLIIYYIYKEEDSLALIHTLATMASSFTILTIAAPMSKLMHVVRVKSTECLPFPMILMSLFVSMLWYLYGKLNEDFFLWVTNLIGAILAVAQLSLFVIYPNRSRSPMSIKNIMA